MEDCMIVALKHARCLAEQLHRCNRRYIVHIALKELGIPSGQDGFLLAKNTILFMYEKPFSKLKNGAYVAAGIQADPPMDSDQVEQAIRRAIKSAWNDRNEDKWNCYFPVGRTGRDECPSNRDFLMAVVDFIELWQGCCEEVNYVRK